MSSTPKRDVTLTEERRYRLLLESVTDYAIYMLDTDGIIVSWNPGAQRFKGYTKAEIIGEHFSRFYTDEDRATALPERALRAAREEGRFEQEGWRVRKDGTRMWAHVVIDPVRDEEGALIGYAKITRDITGRREAENELRRSEERFRLLVQGVKDYAIYMLDPFGYITNWNSGAQRFKGYTEAEIIGEHFSRFYTDEDRQAGLPARALETAAREGQFTNEGWRVRKDGSRFWADVVIDAIRDANGSLLGFAKVTRDVTERLEARRALEEAHAKFVQAQKMEIVGQLTGGVAHDFNNLLAVVLGNLELARKRVPDDPKLRQLIDNSMEAAKRGSTLTQRMLSFARRQDLKTEATDVPSLVRNMADLLQRSIGPTVHVTTQFPLRLRRVMVDPNQLELAILNLIVNARDAMPKGGTITILAREEEVGPGSEEITPGSYVRVSISDTGEGMDEKTLARAIEPFFTTKGVGRGTGLGLSMVHGFAHQSGGRLTLESQKGKGTTAALWLPAAELVAASEVPEDEAARVWRPPVGPALRVLVVDDDALVLMNTAAMLEDMGHDVVEATSGEQALRILRRGKAIDMVVTDQLMPGMTGLQLIGAIREEWPDLPAVLATGFSEMPSGGEFTAVKLDKPFTQEDLARALVNATPGNAEARIVPFRSK